MPSRFKTILLVEDDSFCRTVLEIALADRGGFEVIPSESADDALSVLALRPDVSLVLTDQTMPGTMDGLGLAHHVARHWPDLPVVLMSGRSPQGVLPERTRFLRKPPDGDVLISVINEMLVPRQDPPLAADLSN